MKGQKKRGKIIALIIVSVVVVLVAAFIIITLVMNITNGNLYPLMELKPDNTYVCKGISNGTGISGKNSPVDTFTIPAVYEDKPVTEVSSPTYADSQVHAYYLSVKTIIVEEGITEISDNAFPRKFYENLQKVVLPSTIEKLGSNMFDRKTVLEFAGNDKYSFENGCLVEKETNALVYAENANLPSGLKILRPYSLAELDIGEYDFAGIETIENNALYNSVLCAEPDFSSLKTIGDYAFGYSKGLKTVNLPVAETIGEYAFKGSSIESITISKTLQKWGEGAFEGSALTDMYYPGTLEEADAFIKSFSSQYYYSYPGGQYTVHGTDDSGYMRK